MLTLRLWRTFVRLSAFLFFLHKTLLMSFVTFSFVNGKINFVWKNRRVKFELREVFEKMWSMLMESSNCKLRLTVIEEFSRSFLSVLSQKDIWKLKKRFHHFVGHFRVQMTGPLGFKVDRSLPALYSQDNRNVISVLFLRNVQ